MTEKLRVYLTFDEAFSCEADPASTKLGRPALKHKVILSTKEDQSASCSLLLSKFCEKYNSQFASSADSHLMLAPDRLQLQLGATLIKGNFQPITNYVSDYNDVQVRFLPPAEAEVQHEEGSVPCTNFGCGKRFVPGRDDKEESCAHHAGKPVFHDTYKFWSCCKEKKSMEFTEFEKIPPCAKGIHRHDPVSAAVAVAGGGGSGGGGGGGGANAKELLDRKPLTEDEIRALGGSSSSPLSNNIIINNNKNNNKNDNTNGEGNDNDVATAVRGPREFNQGRAQEQGKPVDAEGNYKCRRFGCGKKFHPSQNGPTACNYHAQGPVFHDTYKFWACCKEKKCADFADFEKVPTCAVGEHLM